MRSAPDNQVTLDVRTKLLVMLAVLSLPLLVISLLLLTNHRDSLTEQASGIARLETAVAASALEAWADDHPEHVRSAMLPPEEAREFYAAVRRRAAPDLHTSLVIFDAAGRPVTTHDSAPSAFPSYETARPASPSVAKTRWSDGVERITGFERDASTGWGVAVGVPLPENTPAGRSILIIMATWALMLVASCLIAVWAVGRFTKPLRKLASSASKLGEGKLRERVAVETGDEIGSLARNFNLMAARLQAKFEAVEKQSAFIGEVLDSLPLSVVVLDAKLVVRKVNSTFAALTGRDASALTGRGLYEAAAGLASLSDVIEDVRRTREPFVNYGLPLELVSREREGGGAGRKFWDVIVWPVTERSEGRGDLLLILSEVSKRVRAEKLATAAFAAEKARAAELESVINQMDEGVVILDATGSYRVNPSAARVLGMEAGQWRDGLGGLVAGMALRGEDGRVLPAPESPLARAFERGEHVLGERYKVLRGDGEQRVLAVGATPLAGEGGETAGVVAVFRDVTEEVRSHEELVSAYDRLREHDRLKTAFVASVSHELRTPLNVIIGMCQLLARDPVERLAPAQSDSVRRVERNARTLLELVNKMLEYSRLEAGRSALDVRQVEVGEVVREVAESFAGEAAEKLIDLRIEIGPDAGRAQTDLSKLRQVISYLVSNAVKFTAEGAVSVSCGAAGDDRWFVEVEDTGIGIPSEALSYIFEGFRQVDDKLTRAYKGVGLGLAITRRIVELLEGEIAVESRPGEGSRFRVVWPRRVRQRTGTGSLVSRGGAELASAAEERFLRAR